MSLRTDMAFESAQSVKKGERLPDGIEMDVENKGRYKLTRVRVKSEEASKKIEKPKGIFYTLELFDYFEKELAELICSLIRELENDLQSVLIIGLGNEEITPDSLGTKTADRILASRHVKKNAPELENLFESAVSVIKTGVMGKTGLESSEIAKAVCEKIKPSCVICIDALCCKEISHIGKTIQITDTGISPGSGVGNSRKELSERSLGAKCIAIGVPTVCSMENEKNMIVTSCEIDRMIKFLSQSIALGVNMALHPKLSQTDLENLTN